MAHRALDEVVNAAVQEGLELLGVSLYTADLVRAARIGKNRCFSAMSRYEFTPPILAPE